MREQKMNQSQLLSAESIGLTVSLEDSGLFHLKITNQFDNNDELLNKMSEIEKCGYEYFSIGMHPEGGKSIIYKKQ